MHSKFSKTARTTAVALVLAAGAGVVLGTAPASAATSSTIDFELASRSPRKPAWDPSVRETRDAASKRCFGVYGFNTRDYKPEEIGGFPRGDGSWSWWIKWRCYSN